MFQKNWKVNWLDKSPLAKSVVFFNVVQTRGGQTHVQKLCCKFGMFWRLFYNINEHKKYFWGQICRKIFNILWQMFLTDQILSWRAFLHFLDIFPEKRQRKCSNGGWRRVKAYMNNVKKNYTFGWRRLPLNNVHIKH